jgi:ankyrin repeat protein
MHARLFSEEMASGLLSWKLYFAKDVNALSMGGRPLLHDAVIDGDMADVVAVLARPGVNVNMLSCHAYVPGYLHGTDCSALFCAVVRRRPGIVRMLLQDSAIDPNLGDTTRHISPLYYALTMRDVASVEELLHHAGTDVNQSPPARVNHKGKPINTTPLQMAVEAGYYQAVDVMLPRVPDDRAELVLIALWRNNAHVLQRLLADSALRTGAADWRGRTLLHRAAAAGGALFALVLARCEEHLNAQDWAGETPLHVASATALELLSRWPGVDATLRTEAGHTALHAAAASGNAAGIPLLLARADIRVNDTTHFGRTALMEAARRGHADAVAALLQHPATDRAVVSARNESAQSLATDPAVRRLLEPNEA